MHHSSLVIAVLGAVVMLGCPPPPKAPDRAPPAPQILAFTASTNEVAAGSTVTLQWETRDATSVQLTEANKGLVSGVDAALTAGSVPVVVDQNTLFILTARNDRGVRESAVVQVAVNEGPRGVLFVSTPRQIAAGESSVLAWFAIGAKELEIHDERGNALDLGAQLERGSVKVSPTATTAYRLIVDGDEYEAQVDVNPRVSLFTATPAAAIPGQPLTLRWQTSGASRVMLSSAEDGALASEADPAKVADGSFTLDVPKSLDRAAVLTFTLRAEGALAESFTEQKLTVSVEGQPKITEFQVPEYAREGRTFTISWKTSGADSVELLRNGVTFYRSLDLASAAVGGIEIETPAADETYQLRAIHSRGGEALSAIENVDPVGAPTVSVFETAPAHIANGGDPITLTWNVPSARNVRIRVKDSFIVTERTGPAAESGTIQVYPNEDTEWVLEADNGLGETLSAGPLSAAVAGPAGLVYTPNRAVPAGTPLTVTAASFSGAIAITGVPHSNVLHNEAGEAFIDISLTGDDTFYTGPNFTNKEITLPEIFTTAIYGVPVSTKIITININGWMMFGKPTVSAAGTDLREPLPSPRLDPLALAPFWEDLSTEDNTAIFYQLDWAKGARRLIVQWNSAKWGGPGGPRLTFQVQIYSTGKVVYAYGSVNNVPLATPSIGVINGDGRAAVTAPVRPVDGDTFTFFGTAPLPVTFPAPPGKISPQVNVGTDGFINVDLAPSIIPAGQFVISEVNANPPASVANGQWIELENKTATPFDLDGWELDFGGGNVHTLSAANGATEIPANGRLVLAQSDVLGNGVSADYVYGQAFSMPAGGGTMAVGLLGGTYALLDFGSVVPGYSVQRGAITSDPSRLVETGVTEMLCTARHANAYGTNQYGTPGQANSPCPVYRYAGSTTITAFEALSSSPTAGKVAFTGSPNESIDEITLPVPVRYGGQPYSKLWVSTNGFISLDAIACTSSSNCLYGNKTSLNPGAVDSGLIAPYWDDLIANAGGGIWWDRKVPGLAPNDGYTVVSWEDFKHDTSSFTGSLNFQVRFYDTGDIEFVFGTMSGSNTTLPRGSSATTWLEDPTGLVAFKVNTNSTTAPGIRPMTAYRFVHE